MKLLRYILSMMAAVYGRLLSHAPRYHYYNTWYARHEYNYDSEIKYSSRSSYASSYAGSGYSSYSYSSSYDPYDCYYGLYDCPSSSADSYTSNAADYYDYYYGSDEYSSASKDSYLDYTPDLLDDEDASSSLETTSSKPVNNAEYSNKTYFWSAAAIVFVSAVSFCYW